MRILARLGLCTGSDIKALRMIQRKDDALTLRGWWISRDRANDQVQCGDSY
jgi:hypothetical protein